MRLFYETVNCGGFYTISNPFVIDFKKEEVVDSTHMYFFYIYIYVCPRITPEHMHRF